MKLQRPINQIIIHCSDTPNGRWTTAADIDRWHGERDFRRQGKFLKRQNPHLKHIGYHFVIYTNGAVATGRHLEEVGAHAKGYNANSIGICLVGRDRFSQAQWQSLSANISGLKKHFADAGIIGHNEVNHHKTCPGFDVEEWLMNGREPLEKHLLHFSENDNAK